MTKKMFSGSIFLAAFFLTPIISNAAPDVCALVRGYPKAPGEKLSFESGEISAICRPFVKFSRSQLDRCDDQESDPYATASQSHFTWASRNEMSRRGKSNLLLDLDLRARIPSLKRRINDLKSTAGDICCGSDVHCRAEFGKVDVSLCQPSENPNSPDPCVFGGNYKMSAEGYEAIFRALYRLSLIPEGRVIAERNLGKRDITDGRLSAGPRTGAIVLSSYVSRRAGEAELEPIILHELGHACSMIRIQATAIDPKSPADRALRAVQWLDSARRRCDRGWNGAAAYADFWESLGESRELASCLSSLSKAHTQKAVDRPCGGLCGGHYFEESVGIAFSLLAGDVRGLEFSSFPNTCDHVRDGQHPLVSDVAECLAQHSPRFRAKIKAAYACS